MVRSPVVVSLLFATAVLAGACGGSEEPSGAPDASPEPPERASDHFMMPQKACVDGGDWCFWNANGGAVPAPERFLDHGDCPTVRTQGIPWQRAVNAAADTEPRLDDPAFASEFAWVTEQVEATACMCCHDSDSGSANIYDVSAEPFWPSAMTNRGLMMAAGIINTDVLGAFPPDDNHGFDRYTTVFPTADVERFQQFFLAELEHRGVTQADIDNAGDLGGPLTENALDPTERCADGVGIDASGVVHWPGGSVRYAWVLEPDAVNPGTPPNLDRPVGTIWQASVYHEDDALGPGELAYSSAPAGATQTVPPASDGLPALVDGETYKLFLIPDHGEYLLQNCTFTYPVPTP